MAELIDITIPGQKKSYLLKDVTIIGRASTTDIKFDDLIVSRHHARICKKYNPLSPISLAVGNFGKTCFTG